MKKLLAAVVAGALLWAGYWFVQSSAARGAIESAVAEARDAGWTVDYTDLSLGGFPNRIDATFTDLVLAPPGEDWRWEGPFLQVFRLVYNPDHLILAFTDRSRLERGDDSWEIAGTGLRASAVSDGARLLRIAAEAERLELTGSAGRVALQAMTAGLQAGENARVYRATLAATPENYGLDPSLRAVADLRFARPPVIGAPFPGVEKIVLDEARLARDGETFTAEADLLAGGDGRFDGDLALVSSDWTRFVPETEDAQRFAETARGLLALMGQSRELDLSLEVEDGRARLGPLTLFTLPEGAEG